MATITGTTEKTWDKLTPDERLKRRLEAWRAAADVKFASPQAKADYQARVKRMADACLMKMPDRVPIIPMLGNFPPAYCGYSQKDVLYDVDKTIDVAMRTTLDFQCDVKFSPAAPMGRLYELIDTKLRTWPGVRGMPDDGEEQFHEGEYMKADEYDAYLEDPSDFHIRTYLPRTWGAAEALAKLPALSQLNQTNISRFGLPEVQQTLNKLMEAGKEALAWQPKIAAANRRLSELGFPTQNGPAGLGGAPFDNMGDSLRGTRGIVWDMFQQPEKLLRVLDIVTEKKIRAIRRSADSNLGECPFIGFALHKGADGFMSDAHFRTFYWPTLRHICLELIEQGYVPWMRTQGGYESRLKAIQDLPAGKMIWHFYLTDIDLAEEALGDKACIVGGVPNALLCTGTPEQVKDFCRKLIDTAGKDGGFILSTTGAAGRTAKVENIKAMIEFGKEYGTYA